MLFRTALRNIRRSKLMSLLTVCEMTCAVVITLVMVSSVLARYRYYEPFRDMLRSDGLYCEFNGAANTDFYGENSQDGFLANEDIFEHLHSPEKIAAVNLVSCNVVMQNGLCDVSNYSYNDEIIRRFKPKLSAGRWLEESGKAERLECVVSANDMGWEVGSGITLDLGGKRFEAAVVGVLEESARLPGGFAEHSRADDFNIFFNPYNSEIEEKPLLVFSSEYLEKLGAVQSLFSGCIITYPDGVSDEQLSADQRTLAGFGCAYSVTLRELDENSRLYLFRHVYDMLPVVVVILVMTFVSQLCSAALTARTRLRDYAVFCICGMRRKQAVMIELIRCAELSAVSLVMSLTAAFAASEFLSVSISFSIQSLVCVAAMIVSFLIVSLAAPSFIIGRSTLKQIVGRR